MLKASDIRKVIEDIKGSLGEEPFIFVAVKNGKATYEVCIYKPHVHNVGRGDTLQAAAMHLKERNGLGGNSDSKRH